MFGGDCGLLCSGEHTFILLTNCDILTGDCGLLCSGEPTFILLTNCVILIAGSVTLCLEKHEINASSSQADLVLFLPDH